MNGVPVVTTEVQFFFPKKNCHIETKKTVMNAKDNTLSSWTTEIFER